MRKSICSLEGASELTSALIESALSASWWRESALGDGTFQPSRDYQVGQVPRSVAIGDLNGDGRPDLANAKPPTRPTRIVTGLQWIDQEGAVFAQPSQIAPVAQWIEQRLSPLARTRGQVLVK